MISYRRTRHLASRTIHGKAYVVNTETSVLHELTETGTFIWGLLEHPASPEAIARHLTEIYEVSSDEARKDVEEFLRELEGNGLVQVDVS